MKPNLNFCPICSQKMKSFKNVNFISKLCNGFNHFIKYNIAQSKIVFLKFSLDPKYNAFAHIDIINNSTEITFHNSKLPLKLNHALSFDINKLNELKSKINKYLLFK